LQAQVFGAGYPSLPVYSIEQFYDQLAERGLMPDADAHHHQEPKGPVQIGGGVTDKQKDEEKAQKDLLEDLHDEEQLRKEREWDEFKDDHKRGSGNRFNRS
jgi:immunoglobulin-binding protein 1